MVATGQHGGEVAAGILAATVRDNPRAVLGVATGSTPLSTWSALARERLDLSRVRAFALDEYVGLPAGHPQSYASVVRREIVRPLGLDPSRVRVPDGGAGDLAEAAADFERELQDVGGVQVQVLGIGANGHIAFNEPGSPHDSLTRVERLSEQTRWDNARFFGELAVVPQQCVTQGIGTILRARSLVLLAYGERKARALSRALDGPIDVSCPASALQLHDDVTVIADTAAASLLKNRAPG